MIDVGHFRYVTDILKEEFFEVLDLAADLKANIDEYSTALQNKTLIMYFEKPSTRTRLSFEAGMTRLGGHAIFFTGGHIEDGKESLRDTAAMYSRFGDIIMARTFEQSDIDELAKYATIPVINGLSNERHPLQALADLLTIREYKGFNNGTVVAWFGDGNNVCNSLILACAYAGLEIRVATPDIRKFKPDEYVVELARRNGGKTELYTNPKEAAENVDVLITDTWTSMGDPPEEKAERKKIFKPYQVNEELMALADSDAIFMHCLPAYPGCEVTKEVINGLQSVVYNEAENRMHTQNALMIHLLNKI